MLIAKHLPIEAGMNHFRRRDWFYGVMAVVLLVAYYVFDISIYTLGWPAIVAILALCLCLHNSLVVMPFYLDELQKQKDANERLNEKIITLSDKVNHRG